MGDEFPRDRLKCFFRIFVSANGRNILYFRNNVSESESNLCLLLGHAVNISSELARTSFEPGAALDHIMKLLTRLYTTVGLLAKYFFVKCKSSKLSVRIARFDKLVHLIGNTLTQNVYNLISYVQVSNENKSFTFKKDKHIREISPVQEYQNIYCSFKISFQIINVDKTTRNG